MPARGSRTYLSRNIFKEMPARGRRPYPLRNIFKDMQARGRRTTCLGIFSKSCRLVVGGHTGRRGPAVVVEYTAALTEMISAFPET